MKTIPISKVNSELPESFVLITFSSFESRSNIIIKNIEQKRIIRHYILRNIDPGMKENNEKNYIDATRICRNNETFNVSLNDPVNLSKGMLRIIESIIKTQADNLVVDITTFTHEALLIFLRGIQKWSDMFDNILILYNPSQKYAEWLSKGCKEVRNVMGYPGYNNPIKKDHLIILTGFEKERATQLVEEYEPDYLSIGSGIEPTNPNHQNTMDKLEKDFEKWFNNLSISWDSFKFSCNDVMKTVKKLIDLTTEIEKSGRNVQIAALNTKLSTMAAGIVAIKNHKIQLIYPIPESYNMNYAEPSDVVDVLDLKELLLEIVK